MGTVIVDACRVQLHEDNRRVAIFSKNAFDLAPQLHRFAARLSQLVIIGGELVATTKAACPTSARLRLPEL